MVGSSTARPRPLGELRGGHVLECGRVDLSVAVQKRQESLLEKVRCTADHEAVRARLVARRSTASGLAGNRSNINAKMQLAALLERSASHLHVGAALCWIDPSSIALHVADRGRFRLRCEHARAALQRTALRLYAARKRHGANV